MTIQDFVDKLRRGYNASEKLTDLILEEYDSQNVNWYATYEEIKRCAKPMSNIGAIHTCIIYKDRQRDEPLLAEIELLEREKARLLRNPEYFKSCVKRYHPWYNFDIDFSAMPNLRQQTKIAHANANDMFKAAKHIPDCPEKDKLRELYKERMKKAPIKPYLNADFEEITNALTMPALPEAMSTEDYCARRDELQRKLYEQGMAEAYDQ